MSKTLDILPPLQVGERKNPWMMVSGTGVSHTAWQRLKDGQPDPDGKGPAGVYWSGDADNFGLNVFVIEGEEPVFPIAITKDGYEESFTDESLAQAIRESAAGAVSARGATRLNAVMSDRNDNVISMWDLYDGNEAMVWGVGDNHYYFRYELPQPNPVKWNRDPDNLPDYCGQGRHNCHAAIHDWEKIYPLFSQQSAALSGMYVQAYKVVPDGIEPSAVSWTPIPAYLETGLTGTVKGEDPDWIAWTPKGTPQKVFRLPRIDLLDATQILESDTLVSGRRYGKREAKATLYLTAQHGSFLRKGEYYVPGDVRQWVWQMGATYPLRINNFLKAHNDGNPSTHSFSHLHGGKWTLGETVKAASDIFEWTNRYGDPLGSRWRGGGGPAGDGNFRKDGNGCMEHGIPRMTGIGDVFAGGGADVCGTIDPNGFLRIRTDMTGLWKRERVSGSHAHDTTLLSSVMLTLNLAGRVVTKEVLLDRFGKPFSNVSLNSLRDFWHPTPNTSASSNYYSDNNRKNINIGPTLGIKEWNLFTSMSHSGITQRSIGYTYFFIPSDIFSPQLHHRLNLGNRGDAGDIPLCTNIELTYNNSIIT